MKRLPTEEDIMISQLTEKVEKTNALIYAGLDPVLSYVPEYVVKKSLDTCGEILEGTADVIWQLNEEIIDHTFNLIPAVKPQTAICEQFGVEGLAVYKKTVNHCCEKGLIVIGSAKKGDIGSTFAAYAAGHLSRMQVGSKSLGGFNVGILTVGSYLGIDGVKPLVGVYKSEDKGLFVLVKTSSPSNGEFQDRLIDGKPLYEWVAVKVEEWGSGCMDGKYSNVGTVTGATYPEVNGTLRKLMSHTHFLIPGCGAQGGMAADLKHRFNQDGLGAVVNSFRGIIAAYKQGEYKNFEPEHFGEASRQAVVDVAADINSVL